MLFACVGAEQRAIGDHVDDARHAARQTVQFTECAIGEQVTCRARNAQAVADVGNGLWTPERLKVIAAGHALGELAQVGFREHGAQFRLADQEDLQQLLRRGLEVGQQPHLLQHIGGEVLRLVHHQHDAAAAAVRVEQEMRQQVHQRLDAAHRRGRHLHVQLVADALQELRGRHARVQDQRDVTMRRQLLQQAPQHGGLARADFAGQLDESTGFGNAVCEVRERFRVPLAEVEVTRVGRDRERLFCQAKKAGVHACETAPVSAGRP